MKPLVNTVAVMLALASLGTAFGQDPALPNPVTMGHGPEKGSMVPAWIFYWGLGIASVVVVALVGAIKVLWNRVNDKQVPGLTEDERAWVKAMHDVVSKTDNDGMHRIYVPMGLKQSLDQLHETAQQSLKKLQTLSNDRQDRATMREAFEREKTQMRSIYTEELKSIQQKLEEEQAGRRRETQELWKQNNDTTREVMTVIKDMIVALDNNSRVMETLTLTGEE